MGSSTDDHYDIGQKFEDYRYTLRKIKFKIHISVLGLNPEAAQVHELKCYKHFRKLIGMTTECDELNLASEILSFT